MIDKWEMRFERIRQLAWIAAIGVVCAFAAWLTADYVRTFLGVVAAMLIAPCFIYAYVVIIWHWKDRYRGKHPDLWGALILLETSGWMKLVYFFRHMIPDMNRTGRYRIDL
jgi:hypothetical protein